MMLQKKKKSLGNASLASNSHFTNEGNWHPEHGLGWSRITQVFVPVLISRKYYRKAQHTAIIMIRNLPCDSFIHVVTHLIFMPML